jgi:hypothetical protein
MASEGATITHGLQAQSAPGGSCLQTWFFGQAPAHEGYGAPTQTGTAWMQVHLFEPGRWMQLPPFGQVPSQLGKNESLHVPIGTQSHGLPGVPVPGWQVVPAGHSSPQVGKNVSTHSSMSVHSQALEPATFKHS